MQPASKKKNALAGGTAVLRGPSGTGTSSSPKLEQAGLASNNPVTRLQEPLVCGSLVADPYNQANNMRWLVRFLDREWTELDQQSPKPPLRPFVERLAAGRT